MKDKIVLLFLLLLTLNFAEAAEPDPSGWKIVAQDPSHYAGIFLASGRIGLLSSASPFNVQSILLNNVFEYYVFDQTSHSQTSHVLKGLNFACLDMVIDGDTITEKNIQNWEQVLDMKEAKLVTSFRYKDKAKVSYSLYALRGMPYAALTDVQITALENVHVTVGGKITSPSEYRPVLQIYKKLHDNEAFMPLLQTVVKSSTGKHTLAATATFVFEDHFSPELNEVVNSPFSHSLVFNAEVEKNKTFQFSWAGAICTTGDFSDPQSESERMAIYILQGNKKSVIADHIKKWEALWQGDIEIDGDLESQRDVRLALYHLYAFSCPGSGLSIPPMGLSSQGYNGHIFWDTELWMYPPLLVLHPEIARSMVDYRYNRLQKAVQKASDYGYEGAMFPWESDDTGEEATPTFALTGAFEQHITADVGIAFWNYFRVTGDTLWLKQEGFPTLEKIADFWVSRATENPDGSYSIKNVVGADEYAQNIDDNAFTNGSAKLALNYAARAAGVLNKQANPLWNKVSEHLCFYSFPDGVTQEYKNYNGQTIKQADVNMLAYPLQIETDSVTVIKNLNYYEGKMDKNGPAMGAAILSVLSSRLGQPEEAFRLFKKAYIPNKRPPFGALTESAYSNNPYFATGAGGMLQAVIFGFGGLEITDKGIVQHFSYLPEEWKSLTIKGVCGNGTVFKVMHHQK